MDTWELAAREHVRDLVARYNAAGDSGRFDDVVALFWEDAEMEVGGPAEPVVHRGHDGIRNIFTGAAARWAPDTPQVHHVRHSVATLVIDVDDEAHARAYSYFSVVMPHGLDHWGRYLDRFEARDRVWRFLRRRVVADGHSA